MARNRTPYYESENPGTVVRGFGWRALVVLLAVLAVSALISAVAWGISVATSDLKGQGDAVKTVNSGDNRLAQQAYFEQTYADIQKATRQLDQLEADKAAHVDGADIRYTGGVTYCQGLVADYNAAARKEIAAKFRDVGLPAQIDNTDPTTSCAPSTTPTPSPTGASK